MTSSYVYIAEAQNGMVKIGFSTNPVERVRQLCAASPIKIRLIGIFEGDLKTERALHHRFAEFSGWNEWFFPVSEVARFVDEHRGCGGIDYPKWDEIGPYLFGKAEWKRKKSEAMRRAWADPERNQSLVDGQRFRRGKGKRMAVSPYLAEAAQ